MLALAISLVRQAEALLPSPGGASSLQWHGREPKADIDVALSEFLVSGLGRSGLPVMSEEGPQDIDWRSAPCWIVDPLDGTLNFVREAGPSMISLCLWDGVEPSFGVLLDIRSRALLWGGAGLGSWKGRAPIAVSNVPRTGEAVLCTGFPASFDFDDIGGVQQWLGLVSRFGKVRMVGSAAASLAMVASGVADVYYERSVKIWDVAAGLALLQGAGGRSVLKRMGAASVSVVASNGSLFSDLCDKV